MLPAGLVIGLLCAVVTGQTAVLLNVSVGDSVLIPCSVEKNIEWFYWQEHNSEKVVFHWESRRKNEPPDSDYRNRTEVFESGFSSRNISIRLKNVTIADDQKSFWVIARYKDETTDENQNCDHCCNSTLQVSAPYRDIKLTIDAANAATCTARGGYPNSSVSWCGQKKTDGECVDLHGAKTSHEENPKDGTFTIKSSISVWELNSVTCRITNPRSSENTTKEIPTADQSLDSNNTGLTAAGVVSLLLLVVVAAALIYRNRFIRPGAGGNSEQDSPPNEGLRPRRSHGETQL